MRWFRKFSRGDDAQDPQPPSRSTRRRLERERRRARERARSSLRMEPLEPRLLLSADPAGASLAVQAALDTHSLSAALWRPAAEPDADLHSQLALEPTAPDAFDAQNIVLDLDGARDARYDGPVTADEIEIPEFRAPDHLAGQEDAIVASMLEALQGRYGPNVVFRTDVPTDEPYSTVYVGGRGEGFPGQDQGYLGLAESVDTGNANPWDEAFVFSELVPGAGQTAVEYGRSLAEIVAHETGHLLGLHHAHEEAGAQDPLAEVAFKPYTHVEVARDVLAALTGGQLAIGGDLYTVNPLVVHALTAFPEYYFAGTVGPDGFPDVLFGQAVIHPTDTGTWLTRVLDMAWSIQDASVTTFSADEKSQALAWAYGFLTHAAGDFWAHTLVNEFAEGVFPAVKDIVRTVTEGGRDLANAVRHFLVEGYLGDATLNFDNNPERGPAPGGDISDDSTPGIPFAVPTRFVYESLIKPFAEDPTKIADTAMPRTSDEPPSITVDSGANAFRRNTGSFIEDGFKVGQKLVAEGFGQNNGTYYVQAVTATVLTVKGPAGTLKAETESDLLRGDERLSVGVPFTGPINIGVDTGDDAFTRGTGSFIDDGFIVGQRIAAYGFTKNDDVYHVVSVAEKKLVVDRDLVDAETDVDLNEQLVGQGKRGPAIDAFLDIQSGLAQRLLPLASVSVPNLGVAIGSVLDTISDGDTPGSGALDRLKKAYFLQWSDSIEYGLRNWGDLGLAFTKAFFDPQSRRDLQNEERGSFSETSTTGIKREKAVGITDVFFELLDDPDRDGFTEDSFINNNLLPMLGIPRELAFVRTGLQALGTIAGEIVAPFRAVLDVALNPIRDAITDVKDSIKDFLKKQLEERFGVPFDAIEFLTDAASKLDLASIEFRGQTLPIFRPGDHERLDDYLHLPSDHLQPPPDDLDSLEIAGIKFNFYDDAQGGLKDGVSFDKNAFAAYANSVQLAKILLLGESQNPAVPDADPALRGQLSALMENTLGHLGLAGVQPYDFGKLNLNGQHGGNILTSTLPGIENDRPGVLLIDTDQGWRADSLTTTRARYRVNTHGAGDRDAVYLATVNPGAYTVQASWLANVTQDVDNRENSALPDEKILPARNAVYRIFDDQTLVGTVTVDQRLLPIDFVDTDGISYRSLGVFQIASGKLRVELDPEADGNVLAGPIRYAPGPGNGGGSSGVIEFSELGRTLHFDTTADQIVDGSGNLLTPEYVQVLGDLVAFLNANPTRLLEIQGHTDGQGTFEDNQALSQRRADAVLAYLKSHGIAESRMVAIGYGEDRPVVPGSLDGDVAANRRVELVVKTGWEDLKYRTGATRYGKATSIFPLWESEVLRPVFRELFNDWQLDGTEFRALGDATSPDPNRGGPAADPRESHATPIGPEVVAPRLVIPILEHLQDDIERGLDKLVDLAHDIEELSFFQKPLPLINKSPAQLLDLENQVQDKVRTPVRGYLDGSADPRIVRDRSPTLNELFGPAAVRSGTKDKGFAKLSDDAAFDVTIDGQTHHVVVAKDNSNTNRGELIADINAALASSGLAGVLVARADLTPDADNYQIVLEAASDDVHRFTLSNLNGAAENQLELVAGQGESFAGLFDSLGELSLDEQVEVPLDFGTNFGTQFGLELSTSAKIKLDVQGELDLGLTLGNTPQVTIQDFSLGVVGAIDPLNTRMRIGFLGASIVNGSVAFDAAVALKDSVGSISLGSLGIDQFEATGSLDAKLPVSLSLAGLTPAGAQPTILITSSDLFDPSALQVRLDPDVSLDEIWDRLLSFNRLDAAGIVSMLAQLSSFLEGVRQSSVVSSIDIPLVEGALDKVLDLAAVLSKALLYDKGADGVIDGDDALANDVNAALAEAGLEEQFIAFVQDGKLVLHAIDPSIRRFSITSADVSQPGADEYGFAEGQSSSDRILKAVNDAAVGVSAAFVLTIVREVRTKNGNQEVVEEVTETSAPIRVDGTGNTRAGDDVPKLVDRSNTPLFDDVQGLANRLSDIVTGGAVNYDAATQRLTYDVRFDGVQLFDVELPTDFQLDLAPLLGFSSASNLILSGEGGLRFQLGFDLSEDLPGVEDLTPQTALADLQRDADTPIVKLEHALVAPADPRTVVGKLSGDANLELTVTKDGKTTTAKFDLPRAQTANNLQVSDLVADLNHALGVASVLSGDLTSLDLPSGATFQVRVDGGAAKTVDVASGTYATLGDLVAAINTGLKTSLGSEQKVIAQVDGARIRLHTGSAAERFEVIAQTSGAAVRVLKLPALQTGAAFDDLVEAQAVGNQLRLVAAAGVSELAVTTRSSDPALREMGFSSNRVQISPVQLTADTTLEAAQVQLASNATLQLSIAKGGSPTTKTVTVTAASTVGNTTIDDLVADINAALQSASVDVEASSEGVSVGNDFKPRILLTAKTTEITQLSLTAASPLLGFTQPVGPARLAPIQIDADRELPVLVGQLTGDAVFTVRFDGQSAVQVTVPRTSTVDPDPTDGSDTSRFDNRNLLDLVSDVQAAINLVPTLNGKLVVSTEGSQLLFTRIGAPAGQPGFMITPGANASELGLTAARTSDGADLLITLSDDTTVKRVTLDGANTIQDVIARIESQTQGAVQVELTADDPTTPADEANTGLTLIDTTAGAHPSGLFRVTRVNGSTAAMQLGILAMDANPLDPDDTPDGRIVGGAIRGATLLDRFYIGGLPKDPNGLPSLNDLADVLDAEVSVVAGKNVANLHVDGVVSDVTTITAAGFDFRALNPQAVQEGEFALRIRGGTGFTPGRYTILEVVDENTVKVQGTAGVVDASGGTGLFSGVQLSANFGGFLGIDLTGVADLGAQLALGFNTAPGSAAADGRLSLSELIDGLSDPLALLGVPEFGPRTGETEIGELRGQLRLAKGSEDFESIASKLLGPDRTVSVSVHSLGDPFLGARFERASYAPTGAGTFTVRGDFSSLLAPSGGRQRVLRFEQNGANKDVSVVSAVFDAGTNLTTVTLAPPAGFVLPTAQQLAEDAASVQLQSDVEVKLPELSLELPNFADLKFVDIISALRAISGFLSQFEAFGFLTDVKIPLINRSIHDLLGFGEELARALDRLQKNPAATLQVLETKLNEAIGVDAAKLQEVYALLGRTPPPQPHVIDLDYDADHDLLLFNFTLGASFRETLDLTIPGIDFGSVLASLGLGNLIDLAGSAGLFAEGGVLVQLAFGLDLAHFDLAHLTDSLFVFETTGVEGALHIGGRDISFKAGVGPFALSIATLKGKTPAEDKHAEIQIEAHATAGLRLDGDDTTQLGRVALSHLQLGSAFTGDIGGSISGLLPVFFPNDATPIGEIRIGNEDGLAGDLANLGRLVLQTDADQVIGDNSIVIDVSPVVDAIRHFDFTKLDIFNNIFLAIDGLDLILGGIQSVLDGGLRGFNLPLIGEQLRSGARFIESLREDFIAPFRAGIEAARNAAADFANPDKNIVSVLLFDVLGPEGANLLGGAATKPSDVIELDTNLDEFLFDPHTTLKLQDVFMEWNLKLGSVLVGEDLGIGFDLGIPGLGLSAEGDIRLDIEWLLNLGFGLNFKEGFYLKIGDGDKILENDVPELVFEARASAPDAAITGTLGFLELQARNDTREVLGETRTTSLGAMFMVDLRNGRDIFDDKLGFTEIGSLRPVFGVAASAEAILDLTLGLSPDVVGNGIAKGFPKLVGDFNFVWELGHREAAETTLAGRARESTFLSFNQAQGFTQLSGDAFTEGLKLVGVENVQLDLGSLLSDVLGPIVRQVAQFTEPLEPIIDFLTSPVPIIGKFLRVTWLDLAAAFGDVDTSLIEQIADIVRLINDIADASGGSLMIPVGSSTFFDSANGIDFDDAPVQNTEFGDLDGFLDKLEQLQDSGSKAPVIKGTVKRLADGKSGFRFPFIEHPSDLLGLLTGKDVSIVAFDIAPLVAEFEFSQFFPIFGPLGVSLGLTANASFDSAVGFDTRGIREFVETDFRNPALIFNGFFISDSPKLDGHDDPELSFGAALFARAELNLGIASAGVEAALGFKIDFDLFDPDHDGKVRFSEMLGNIENQLRSDEPFLAPLAIFDVEGQVFALLRAFLKIKLGFFKLKKTFNIFGPVKLLDFDIDFFRPPLLATEIEGGASSGDLVINAGQFAKQRLLGNATDLSEHFVIESAGTSGDFVNVRVRGGGSRDSLGSDSTTFLDYKVRKGSKLVIDGGAGDDIFDLSGFVEDGVIFEIDGGAGDDVIMLSDDAQGVAGVFNILRGGEGVDVIHGSAGSDLIFGGLGNDQIEAGAGDDLVFGDDGEVDEGSARGGVAAGDGADMVLGGEGRDILFGGGASDRIEGGASAESDLLISGGAVLLFADPAALKVFGNLVPLERGGIDGAESELDAGATDTAVGGGGGDILVGSAGSDRLEGSAANDILIGFGGADTIDGLGGDDLLFGDGGKLLEVGTAGTGGGTSTATLLRDPGAHFLSDGVRPGQFARRGDGSFVRVLQVTSDTELLTAPVSSWAGAGYSFFAAVRADSVDDAGDRIQGNQGNDLIFAGGGGDLVQGGAGDDEIYGGSGADFIDGDFSQDFPQDPSNPLPFAPANTGGSEGADRIFGEADADVLFGSGGDDLLDGGVGSDQLFGGAGDDSLLANKGSDTVDGEAGSDRFSVVFQGGTAVSLINVFDRGTGPDDFDVFVVEGTFFDDQFLLRSNTAGSIAFVALINSDTFAERANYLGVESITVNAGFGNDRFAVDDTTAQITINGEQGDDFFQVGQLFKSSRSANFQDASPVDGRDDDTGIRLDDAFGTVETTRGFLSNGIRAPMTINGGEGNDEFVVFRNLAVLTLRGDDGEDVFEVRAFALVGSEEPQRERTDITGGAGADLVQYAVNAPVNINGGDGLDTVIILGSEFGDDFVITDEGVFGAGLNVNFVNVELLRVDGSEGDDRFFVQSTKETFVTELFGGLGSDTFSMSGDAPPVVSNDLRGHSGLILHDVESADPRFGDQRIYGISANIGDNDEPFAVVRETGGSTIISETDLPFLGAELAAIFDSYQLVLTRRPDRNVIIRAQAPLPTPDEREREQRGFRVATLAKPGGSTPDGRAVTLEFTPDNWFVPQTVFVLADDRTLLDNKDIPLFTRPELSGWVPDFRMNDDAFEGLAFGVVSHIVESADPAKQVTGTFTALDGPGVHLTIAAPASATAADLLGRSLVITAFEGAGQARFIVGVDTISNPGSFVLTLDRPFNEGDRPVANHSELLIRVTDAITGRVSSIDEHPSGLPPTTLADDRRTTLTALGTTFPADGPGLTGATLEIIGGAGQGQRRLIVGNLASDPTHTLILGDGWTVDPDATSVFRIERFDGLQLPGVEVTIHDDDRPGLVVDPTGAFAAGVVTDPDTITAVIEGGDGDQLGERDVLRIRLNHDPGAQGATVALGYDAAQLLLTDLAGQPLSELHFTSTDFLQPQTVLVRALADNLREGFHSSLIDFTVTQGSADGVQSATDDFDLIPEDEAVFFLGLRQVPSQVLSVVHDGLSLVQDRDFTVQGNRILFQSRGGAPQKVFGKVVVGYQYTDPGFLTSATRPVLARIQDADAPTVLVRQSGGSTDVTEISSSLPAVQRNAAADAYELVLTGRPAAPVTVTVTPAITKTTRTGGLRNDAVQLSIAAADPSDARVRAELRDGVPTGNLLVTFDDQNWDDPVRIDVAAIDDAVVDGGDTQVFAPGPRTLSQILGPVFVEGSGGRGSLSIQEPVLLPLETNLRRVDGRVLGFTPNVVDGAGAVEQMIVATQVLEQKRIALGLLSVNDLVGETVEISRGRGVGVVLDPAAPELKFDRFWRIQRIEAVAGDPSRSVLILQNPTLVDPAKLAPGDVPTASDDPTTPGDDTSSFTLTSLSANFFVDESRQVDVMFVNDQDSPADSHGVLTSTNLSGLNMGPDIVIGGVRQPGGITYTDLEVLDISLGSGGNTFEVLGTPTRADGFQTWTILRTGDDIPFDRGTADPSDDIVGDRVTVRLNREAVPALTGKVQSTTSSGQSIPDAPPAVESSVVVQLDASFGPLAKDALAGHLLRITAAGDGEGEAVGQLRRILHNDATQGGTTRIVLDSNWEDDPTGTRIGIENPVDGAFAVDTQGGDDVVDATGSTQNLYIFGGTGKDTLIGGSGDDVIFGDRGRIDFNDAAGTVVTRLGSALAPITGFVSSQRSVDLNGDAQPDASEITDLGPTLSGGVLIPGFPLPDLLDDGLGNDDIGLRGLSLDINNGRGFAQPPLVIADNDLRTLRLAGLFDPTLDLPGAQASGAVAGAVNGEVDGAPPTTITLDQTFAAGSLRSKAIRLGDGQLRRILDNAGAELTVSGPWETLPAAGSSYRILSSEYRISTLPEDQTDGVVRGPSLLLTIDTEQGGDDIIDAGAGADQIFGGAGADTIRAGTGDDLIAGDGARVDRTIDPTLPSPDVEFDPSLGHAVEAKTFLERMRSIAWNVGGNDEITGAAGADLIFGGAGEDRLYGDDVAGSSGAADGADVIAGDNGEIDFDSLGRPLRIFTVGSAFGGADVITGNAGNDIVFGGAGGDSITGAGGENILFGDHGELRLQPVTTLNAAAPGPFRGVITVFSTDAAAGGSDTISSGNQNDIAFGGAGADMMQVGDGENIALGDDGRATFSDGWLVGLESTDPAVGGVDRITGGRQRDVMVGGQAGDVLSAGGADDFSSDIALGDNGSLVLLPGNILVSVTTTFPDQGGNDEINTGNGSDVVLGGALNDLIDAGSDAAQDIVLGDNGEALFSAAGLLRQIASANPGTGGSDRIRTGAGNDVVIGGDAGDDIETGIVDAGQDIVMGDHAIAHFDARQELLDIESLFPSFGGNDGIATGNGRDVVFGGSGDDVIDAEGPDVAVLENSSGNDDAPDLVVGDHGRATFQGTASFDPGEQFRTLSFSFGRENGFQSDETTVTGPAGATGARAGGWLNLEGGTGLFGDEANERVAFDDGNTAVGVSVRWGTDLSRDPHDANTDTHTQIDPTTQDQRLFEGYLYSLNSRVLQAELTGLGGHFAAYDVYVYLDGDNSTSASTRSVRSISDGTTTYYLDDPDGNHFVGQYVQVSATDPLQPRPGNYVVFRGLTSDRLRLTVAAEGPNAQNRPVLSGIQVVGRLLPIDRVETRFEQFAGSDTIRTGGGSDLVLGGAGSDLISTFGNAAKGASDGDIVAGDNARATLVAGRVVRLESKVPGQVLAPDPAFELRTAQGNDTIRTGNGEDVVLGGFGNDDIDTGIAGAFDNGNIRVLSLNFGSNASEAALAGVAGAVQVDHWNNLANSSRQRFPLTEPPDSATGLVFNDGTSASGIDVTWGRRFETRQPRATSDGTHAGIDPSTQNEALFEGMITTDADDTLGVNLRGLSAHFGSAYDVYVYLDDDNGGQSGERLARRISDGRTTFLLSDPRGNTFQGRFVEVTSTTAVPGVVPQVGNYVVFRNVTGDTFSLRVDDERETFFGANRPTIAAIQVVGGVDRGKVTIGGDFDEDVALGDEGVARFFAGVLHQIETIAPVGGVLGDADTLRGGEDVDLLAGGNGSDDVRGEEGNDVVFGDGVRLRLYRGDLNETLLLNDAIGGDDRLEGGIHDDVLYGQFGQDTFVFAGQGLGTDTVIEAEPDARNDAHDTLDFADFGAPVDVSLSTSGTQSIGGVTDGQRDLRLNLSSASAFEDVIGSAFGDVIVGNFRPNTLIGRQGADVLAGLSGDDALLGGANDDILLGGRDEDLIDGGTGDDLIAGDWTPGNFWLLQGFPFPDLLGEIFNDHDHDQRDVILGGEGNDVIDSGDGRDLVDGEAGDDFIFGGWGDDVLLGGDGADRIDGEFGDDILEGGLGDDKLRSGVVMQQEQGATPLGVGNLLTQFAQRFSQTGFAPVDPTPTDGNDRPLRPWLQPFLDGAVRPRPAGHLGSNPPDAAELVVPPPPPQPGVRGTDVQIARTAVLEAGVVLGDRVRVLPRATIGAGTVIGKDVTIGAGAKIGSGARIGDGVEIQAGAVIPSGSVVLAGKTVGAPGSAGGRWERIPELRERLRGLYPDSKTFRV